MANWNRLTENQFSAIKTLLKGGASQAEAAQYMKVSPNTAFWVNKAETFEEYTNMMAERHLSRKQAHKPEPALQDDKQKGGTLSANYQMNRVIELLKAQNDLLTQISNKLAFIVEQLS